MLLRLKEDEDDTLEVSSSRRRGEAASGNVSAARVGAFDAKRPGTSREIGKRQHHRPTTCMTEMEVFSSYIGYKPSTVDLLVTWACTRKKI